MKTLRYKLTPKPGSKITDITWFSGPDIKGNAEKTLAHVQKIADQKNVAVTNSLVSDLEYLTMRAARAWLMTEPGDEAEDKNFKFKLVAAGLFQDTADIISFVCGQVDDTTVQVITATTCTTI